MFAFIIVFAFGAAASLTVLTESKLGTEKSLFIGAWLTLLGFLLFGPSPLLPFLENTGLWEGVIAVTVMIIGNAFPVILTPPWGLSILRSYGMSEEEASVKTATYSIVLMAIGQFLGPVPASYVAGAYGVGWANTMLGVATAAIVCVSLFVFNRMEKLESAKTGEMV